MKPFFGERQQSLSQDDRIKTSQRRSEMSSQVFDFDHSVSADKLPTVEEFKQACRNRAQVIRDENSLNSTRLSQALILDAERLERAANGDINELMAEATRHSEFYQFMASDPKIAQYRDENQTAVDSWKRLAEISGADERKE
jgi:hypothetical protein